jgi:membrane-associated phospholipid phosphatase
LLCTVLVLLCVGYVDRPVERYVHAHQGAHLLFELMAAPALLPSPIALIYLARCGLGHFTARGLWLQLSVATVIAVAAKDELKWVFGRPWPENWIDYGMYAFHPFATGVLYGGFPSGHTSYIAAPMCVLWRAVPQYRAVWAGVMAMVMVGLVGAGYHFVGDVIAGFFTGLAAAAGTMACIGDKK